MEEIKKSTTTGGNYIPEVVTNMVPYEALSVVSSAASNVYNVVSDKFDKHQKEIGLGAAALTAVGVHHALKKRQKQQQEREEDARRRERRIRSVKSYKKKEAYLDKKIQYYQKIISFLDPETNIDNIKEFQDNIKEMIKKYTIDVSYINYMTKIYEGNLNIDQKYYSRLIKKYNEKKTSLDEKINVLINLVDCNNIDSIEQILSDNEEIIKIIVSDYKKKLAQEEKKGGYSPAIVSPVLGEGILCNSRVLNVVLCVLITLLVVLLVYHLCIKCKSKRVTHHTTQLDSFSNYKYKI